MINPEFTTIELGTNVAGTTTFHKKPILAPKKVALRDVQNNNSNLTCDSHPQNLLPVEGQVFVEGIKTCGMKRLTPDYDKGTHEHFNYPCRKYEFEGNQGRNPGSTEKVVGHPQSANLPQIQPEVGQINGKNLHYGSLLPPNHVALKKSVPWFRESKDDQMTERFIRLQNFIKQCDGSNHRENVQLLLGLSPSELSRHAVELEKRAIQLTIEEGYEMQQTQTLNILGNPSATKTLMPPTHHIQNHN